MQKNEMKKKDTKQKRKMHEHNQSQREMLLVHSALFTSPTVSLLEHQSSYLAHVEQSSPRPRRAPQFA